MRVHITGNLLSPFCFQVRLPWREEANTAFSLPEPKGEVLALWDEETGQPLALAGPRVAIP